MLVTSIITLSRWQPFWPPPSRRRPRIYLPPDDHEGAQDVRKLGVGLLRHGFSPPGSQSGVPRLGACRRCPLQTPVSLLLGRHSLVSGVSARSGGTPNRSHLGREPPVPLWPSAGPAGRAGAGVDICNSPGCSRFLYPLCPPVHEVQTPTPICRVR